MTDAPNATVVFDTEDYIQKGTCDYDFVIVPNSTARDRRLSVTDRGLLIHLLSLPANFRIKKKELHEEIGDVDGRDKIMHAFNNLIAFGYVQVRDRRTPDGKFIRNDYYVLRTPSPENPATVPQPEKPAPENPATAKEVNVPSDDGNPLPENPALLKEKNRNSLVVKKKTICEVEKIRLASDGETVIELEEKSSGWQHPGDAPKKKRAKKSKEDTELFRNAKALWLSMPFVDDAYYWEAKDATALHRFIAFLRHRLWRASLKEAPDIDRVPNDFQVEDELVLHFMRVFLQKMRPKHHSKQLTYVVSAINTISSEIKEDQDAAKKAATSPGLVLQNMPDR